jgi:hypothetical protein
MVFVEASRSILLDSIGSGSYIASIETGTGWDPTKMQFRQRTSFHKNVGPIRFLQIESPAGVTSDHRELVIVPDGPN